MGTASAPSTGMTVDGGTNGAFCVMLVAFLSGFPMLSVMSGKGNAVFSVFVRKLMS